MTEEKRQAFGYMGKILHVDLSLGKTWTEEPNEAFYRTYLGGAGLIGYYLLKEVPAHADPLGPDNRLIFSAGVISGTPIGGAGRHSVGAKSPISGGYGKAEVGGYWGAELKHAGWDAIVIQGKARKPVYLTILDDRAEIHDASKLWGLEVLETENAIKAELGDKQVRVSSIGPAGENLVRFACIISDRRSAAGRCGLGAVMGSKNLKAVAVRGRSKAPIADEKTFKQLAKSIVERVNSGSQVLRTNGTGSFPKPWMEAGGLPINNFRDGLLDNIENNCAQVMRDRNYNIGMDTCFACPTHCKKVLKIGEPWNVIPEYGGLEYETLAALGGDCGVTNLEAIILGGQLCNALGLDGISTGGTIAFAMECFENGLLTLKDTGGIELRFGNEKAMLEVLRLIAKREGVGNLLAEGSGIAAKKIGGGAEKFAMVTKGVDPGMHDLRIKPGMGLVMGINPMGMDHMVGVHDQGVVKVNPKLQSFGLLDEIPANDLGPQKARMIYYAFPYAILQDSLTICQFLPYSVDEMVELVRAVTGWKTNLFELHAVGVRALALARAFNIREGFSPADDVVPERFFGPTTNGANKDHGIDRKAWMACRDLTYQLLGWDLETGKPTQAKLGELGISWVNDAMK